MQCSAGVFSDTKYVYKSGQPKLMLLDKTESYDDSVSGGRWLVESYTHDQYGNRTETIAHDGVKTEVQYETSFNTYPVKEITHASAGGEKLTSDFSYDPNFGGLKTHTDPNNNTITNIYDDIGRPLQRKGPDENGSGSVLLEAWAYENRSADGNYRVGDYVRTTRYSAGGRSVAVFEYRDAFGRGYRTENKGSESASKTVVQSTGFTTAGYRASASAPHYSGESAAAASFGDYDSRGRMRRITQLNGKNTTVAFKKNTGACTGCVTEESVTRDASGGGTSLNIALKRYLDARGQVRKLTHGNGANQIYEYDAAGRLKRLTDGKAQTVFTYDTLGRKKSSHYSKQASGPYGAIDYQYDSAGNLTRIGGTTHKYDGHRLTKHGKTSYKYDKAGNRIEKTHRRNKWRYAYNAEGLPGSVRKNNREFLRNAYGPFAERLERLEEGARQSIYFLDLMEIVKQGNQTEYTIYLPGAEGRVAAITSSGTPSGGPGAAIAPLLLTGLYENDSVDHFFKRNSLRFDYLIGRPGAAAFLKLSLLLVFGLTIFALFLYYRVQRDATRGVSPYRRRMSALAPAIAVLFTGFFVLQCQNDSNRLGGFWGDAERAFNLESSLLSALNVAGTAGIPIIGTKFFHLDGVGSTALVTNGNGNVAARITYKPYGKIHELDGNDVFRPKFGQKEYDPGSDLYNFGARFYDPAVGRFISADSLAIGGPTDAAGIQNRYQYAGNNPVSYQDPTGNFFWLIFLAPIIFLGAVATAVQVTDAIITAATTGDFSKLGVAAVGSGLSAATKYCRAKTATLPAKDSTKQ